MRIIKVLDIIHDSVVDGEGLRVVIFFAGCYHRCNGCHNPTSWSFDNGNEMTLEEIITEVESNPLCKGITFSGGCVMCNPSPVIPLAKKLKELNYNIWCYCGETLEELKDEQLELLKYIDVLVDGKFVEEEKDLSLSFMGSLNQRVLKKGKNF